MSVVTTSMKIAILVTAIVGILAVLAFRPSPPFGVDLVKTYTQAEIDLLVEDVIAQITLSERAYLAMHGEYWQGLSTHTQTPKDGLEQPSDLTKVPPSQQDSFLSLGFSESLAKLPFVLTVNKYVTYKNEWGYEIEFEKSIGGVRYQKVFGYGAQADGRTHDWLNLDPLPVSPIATPSNP